MRSQSVPAGFRIFFRLFWFRKISNYLFIFPVRSFQTNSVEVELRGLIEETYHVGNP